jgi:hypothetical protein
VAALPVQPSHTAVPVVDHQVLHRQVARHGPVISISSFHTNCFDA